MDRTQTGCT